jgi:hypothetical protein
LCLLFHFFVFLDVLFRTFDVILQWRQNMCHSYFMYGVSHEGKYCTSNISRKLLSLLVGVTKVNFMWCVFHNAQRYWSDNLCKLVIDQWRASLRVRDGESCWFTEEIDTYMRCWESPGDLPLVIEIFVSFRSFRCAPLAKRHKISITRGRSPGLSQERM